MDDDDEWLIMAPLERRLQQVAVFAGFVTFVVVIAAAVALLGYYDAWDLNAWELRLR